MVTAARQLFRRYQLGGTVRVEYDALTYWGRL
jgi:hypothetical protein